MKPQYSPSLVEGLRYSREMVVKDTDLDAYWGIGTRNVLAVPVLIAFIEQTTIELLHPRLEEGYESIGIELNLKHSSHAVIGQKIHCNVHLKFIEENNLFFDIAVIDNEHFELTHGAHERMVVEKNNC